jgi:hypothetical protein
MSSLLRDIVDEFRSARTDLLIAWLAFLAFIIGGCAAVHGGEPFESKARAALALAKAKRDREATGCFADYEAAVAEAKRTDKHLVLWVGLQCADHPQIRHELADAIHCHLLSQHGDRTPRIVIQGNDGVEWYVTPEKLGPETSRKIRDKWRGPKVPLLRRDVGISEED